MDHDFQCAMEIIGHPETGWLWTIIVILYLDITDGSGTTVGTWSRLIGRALVNIASNPNERGTTSIYPGHFRNVHWVIRVETHEPIVGWRLWLPFFIKDSMSCSYPSTTQITRFAIHYCTNLTSWMISSQPYGPSVCLSPCFLEFASLILFPVMHCAHDHMVPWSTVVVRTMTVMLSCLQSISSGPPRTHHE